MEINFRIVSTYQRKSVAYFSAKMAILSTISSRILASATTKCATNSSTIRSALSVSQITKRRSNALRRTLISASFNDTNTVAWCFFAPSTLPSIWASCAIVDNPKYRILGSRTEMNFPKIFIAPSLISAEQVVPHATIKLTASNNTAWSALDLLIESDTSVSNMIRVTTLISWPIWSFPPIPISWPSIASGYSCKNLSNLIWSHGLGVR